MVFTRSDYIIGHLFKLTTSEGATYRIQNFWSDNNGVFVFNSEDYQYLPVTYDPPQRNITGNNQDTELALPLSPTLVNLLIANNYFRYSILEAFIISQDFPVTPVIAQDKLVITSYQLVDSQDTGGLVLICQAPFNAINGEVPRLTYTTIRQGEPVLIGTVPEVPLSPPGNL
jgi:hypothetical protein